MVVAGTGTGGTLAGIGRKLKEQLPSVEVSRGCTVGVKLKFPFTGCLRCTRLS